MANALLAIVDHLQTTLISHLTVLSTVAGPKHVANALRDMRVEEMHMLNCTILMDLMMWVCGKSTHPTGAPAVGDQHLAALLPTLLVLRKYLDGEVTHGGSGQHAQPVDAVQEQKKKLRWKKKEEQGRLLQMTFQSSLATD